MKKVCLAITGASGVAYGICTLNLLLHYETEVHLIVSEAAKVVMEHELDDFSADYFAVKFGSFIERKQLFCYADQDIAAVLASGSFQHDGMAVVPCSMDTLAEVAHGLSGTLITRAASVTLKERRPLIVVPRETPLSTIQIQNLLTLSQSGAVILPAMPGFYAHPQTLEDLINFIVGKIFDAMHIEHDMPVRYK